MSGASYQMPTRHCPRRASSARTLPWLPTSRAEQHEIDHSGVQRRIEDRPAGMSVRMSDHQLNDQSSTSAQ